MVTGRPGFAGRAGVSSTRVMADGATAGWRRLAAAIVKTRVDDDPAERERDDRSARRAPAGHRATGPGAR
jgi:hypothetical protein